MAIGPVKQAYLDRVKAAQSARAAKTASPVVEAALQSVKQTRRRRFRQKVDRPLGASAIPVAQQGGRGFAHRGAGTGKGYGAARYGGRAPGSGGPAGVIGQEGNVGGWSFQRRQALGGALGGGLGGAGRPGAGAGKDFVDLSVHKGYREPEESKDWRIGTGRPRSKRFPGLGSSGLGF